MADVDIETFDLAEVLAGRGYPELKVSVYFDEAVAFSIHEYNKKLLTLGGKAYDSAKKELDKLVDELNSERYIFTLRGVPIDVQRNIFKKAQAKFRPKEKAGKEVDQDALSEEWQSLLWAAHIVQIEAPNGAVQAAPDPKTVSLIRGKAPAAAIIAIQDGIDELTRGSKAGFEAAAKSVDFLSDASPEG